LRRFEGNPYSFAVMSRKKAELFTTDEPHVTLSMTSPRQMSPAELPELPARRGLLRLSFDDYDYEARQVPMTDLRGDGPEPHFFSRENALEIRDFVSAHREHVRFIVCHCQAGLSRSPAVAGALSTWLNGNDVVADAISRWVTVDRLELDEGVVVWNRLVYDALSRVLRE
jgi:predicted protein tyrosine phosphatase